VLLGLLRLDHPVHTHRRSLSAAKKAAARLSRSRPASDARSLGAAFALSGRQSVVALTPVD
jgi:hypothetical protein